MSIFKVNFKFKLKQLFEKNNFHPNLKSCWNWFKDKPDFFQEIVDNCLQDLYKYSYPSVDYKKVKHLKSKKDILIQHYISEDLKRAICKWYIDVFRLQDNWLRYVSLLEHYLKNGGYYKISLDNDYLMKKTQKLSDFLSDEQTQKVLQIVQHCKNFYNSSTLEEEFYNRLHSHEPLSDKSIVEQYWRKQGKNIIINDDWWKMYKNYQTYL
jgi:hypothetical protein